jgi:hypothetical protein
MEIQDVTIPEVQAAIKKWIAPLFEPSTSIASVASGLVKMDSIAERLEKAGYEVEKRTFGQDDDDSEGDYSDAGTEDLL